MKNYKVHITKKHILKGSEQSYLFKEVFFDDKKNTEEVKIYSAKDILTERIVSDYQNNHLYYENFVIPIRTFTETVLNDDGKPIEETEFDYDNKEIIMKTKYEYDNIGHCFRQTIIQGDMVECYEYKLGVEGKVKETVHSVNNELDSVMKISIDGNRETSLTSDPLGKQIQKRIKDTSGNKMHEIEYDYKNEPASISEVDYDQSGNITDVNQFDGNHRLIARTEYSYDEQKRLVSEVESTFENDLKVAIVVKNYKYPD